MKGQGLSAKEQIWKNGSKSYQTIKKDNHEGTTGG